MLMGRHATHRFLIRWLTSSLGLWVAAGLLDGITYQNDILVLVAAGFLLAIINSIIKPIVILLSLPAILFSLGLFMIVINGLMVTLLSSLYSRLDIASFSTAILAGMVIGLVNYLVTTILEEK
jgi:putative membrane protein